MRQSLEEFVFNYKFQNLTEKEKIIVKESIFNSVYTFDCIIDLLKQVREATIKECVELSKVKWIAGESGYLDRYSIDDLDKNSIEI